MEPQNLIVKLGASVLAVNYFLCTKVNTTEPKNKRKLVPNYFQTPTLSCTVKKLPKVKGHLN